MLRPLRLCALTTALIALLAAPAASQCRLALALGLDVSSSVDPGEDRLQRAGLASALIAPEVRQAILAFEGAPVALAVFEWSGRYQQAMHLDWVMLDSEAAITSAAERIANSERVYQGWPTAIGYALGYAAGLFAQAPRCLAQKLDISGDGINNEGFAPALAYENFPLGGVTVNALAIGNALASGTEHESLAAYYRAELIRGPGAFVEIARDYRDFERAMTRKLLRELEIPQLGAAQGIRIEARW